MSELLDFYEGRINSAPKYGFRSGQKGSLNLQCLLGFLHIVLPTSAWCFSIVFRL